MKRHLKFTGTQKKPRTTTAVTTKREKKTHCRTEDILLEETTCDLQPAPQVRRGAEQDQPPLQVGRTPTKPSGTESEVTFQTSAYFGWMPPTPKVHTCWSEIPEERMRATQEGDSSKDGGPPRDGPGVADSGSSFWLPLN